MDSPGFSTCRFIRWYNKKYGKDIDKREWVKVHQKCGVSTHIVTSVEISGWEAHDTAFFKPLLETTAKHFRRGAFLEHYHKRSDVETVFSMVEGKLVDAVRSKGDTGMANEMLCKVLCHNLCVLNQVIHELRIEPIFVALN